MLEKLNNGDRFSAKPLNIREKKKDQNDLLSQFSGKSDEKVAPENFYPLKLEFYNIDRRTKKDIRYIFT